MDNLPPIDADPLRDRLAEQYAKEAARAEELLAALDRLPAIDETTIDRANAFIKQLREAAVAAEKAHESEKADYLKAGKTCDTFFGAMFKPLREAVKKVEAKTTAYLTAKADAERKRRQEEARIAREAAEAAEAEARRLREEEDRKAREAADAEAARIAALPPEDDPIELLAIQRDLEEKRQREQDAARERELEALQAAARARQEAEEAQRRADARPADLARTRGALGGTATLATHVEIEITDAAQAVGSLHPYLDEETLKKAARALLRANSATIKAGIARSRGSYDMPGIRFYETSTARVA